MITTPTEAEIQAIDESTFIWDDLLDGILSRARKVVKFPLTQVDADEVIIREVHSRHRKDCKLCERKCY